MRYLMTFSYDGSKYSGYQKQPQKRTIQYEIEEALKTISNKVIGINASGRTDAGVHALNQKAHFDLEMNISIYKLKRALNSLIPKDIYIKDIVKVSDTFHARYDVKAKEYIYKLNIGEYNPIEKDYVYQCNKKLNIIEMKKAIKYFEGTHDFSSFAKIDEPKNDYIRTINHADIIKDIKNENTITISFLGNGFLRYMVRNMVGTLIEIGEGKKNAKEIITILQSRNRTCAGITANPEGLYLKDVFYN